MIFSPNVTWQKNNLRAVFLTAVALFSGTFPATTHAETILPAWAEEWLPTGSLRGSYWNMEHNASGANDIGNADLWLKVTPHLTENITLVAEGWARVSTTPTSANISNSTQTISRLREGYLSTTHGAADLRIGKQIIVWGRADQLNPTDNLSPRDNSQLFVEPDDQRHGTIAAKATYNFTNTFSGLAASAIWLPVFRPNIQPISPPVGISFTEILPTKDQYAFKLEQTGREIDWSLSYFNGYDLNPDLGPRTPQNLALNHHHIQVLGTDAAMVIGRYGVRSEIAYTWTEDKSGDDPFTKNPFLYWVTGADKTFLEYLNINLQYFARRVADFQHPTTISNPQLQPIAIQQSIISSQQDSFQQGVSLRIANKWFNETLDAELAAVYNFTRQDYLLRPKISYAFNDHWRGNLGANIFRGENGTFFGLLKDRSAVFAEIRYGF